ncbi:transposase [Bacillus pseudomycoides]|nr:transposase [Bacillus pseudomycoides]PED06077.1 transposase [Bacillus pseudomycoides]PED70154.1 transposase [Bacillus pseudomycoides]PEI46965.1 transposase [Bacillus pseudomycoides]PEI90869.1 transposase [Bacillus pseudomycoides]
MQSLVIVVIYYTSKKRSLVVANFVFVYIEHERFQCLSRYVKHDEYFDILRI